jgi:hypothetical protein
MRAIQRRAPSSINIKAENELKEANVKAIIKTMKAVTITPFVAAGSFMLDGWPTGEVRTILIVERLREKRLYWGLFLQNKSCLFQLKESSPL